MTCLCATLTVPGTAPPTVRRDTGVRTHTRTHKHTHLPRNARRFRPRRRGQWPRRRRGGDNAGRAQRQSTRASTGLVRRAEEQAKQWTQRKYKRFLGAALSIHPTLFEAANGYPNSFWGWGGEDDALVDRLGRLSAAVTYTVPPVGRLIDLEMPEPVTLGDKLATRVKELQKRERLREDVRQWQTDGVAQVVL